MKTAEEINDLRKRVLAGEEFSAEEYTEIIKEYRAARLAGVSASAPRTKAKAASAAAAAPVELGALLESFGLKTP